MALNDIVNAVGTVVNTVNTVNDFVNDPYGFVRGSTLPQDAMPTFKTQTSANVISADENDWRVRLTVPKQFSSSPVLAPLQDTGGSLVFPFTPNIIMQHAANYSTLAPVHNNYPFPVYENSQIDDIQIIGDYYVENSADAEYWIAAIHFLRSMSKMFYGDTSNQGSPPPITRLNGYGDYVFKDMPVLISMFTVNFDPDVNYIKADIPGASGSTWAPSHSAVTVNLKPVYSRDTVRTFSLDKFVNGDFILDSRGFI